MAGASLPITHSCSRDCCCTATASGVRSSRRIERATYDDLAFRHLAANQHPDHDTIASFQRAHFAALGNLFVQALRLCQRAGLDATRHRSAGRNEDTGKCQRFTVYEVSRHGRGGTTAVNAGGLSHLPRPRRLIVPKMRNGEKASRRCHCQPGWNARRGVWRGFRRSLRARNWNAEARQRLEEAERKPSNPEARISPEEREKRKKRRMRARANARSPGSAAITSP